MWQVLEAVNKIVAKANNLKIFGFENLKMPVFYGMP